MNKKIYSLSIIGGGNITSGYDNPKSKYIVTHLNGALKHPNIRLDSIVEINSSRRDYIKKKWGKDIKIYSDLKKSMSNHKSNIIVVATPTSQHFQVIKDVLSIYNPKLILCEKPIVSNIYELNKLNQLFKNIESKIITNFQRRFDISLNILRDKILKSSKIFHFYGTFNKGFIHNGSHMIDLISMLVGTVTKINSINHKNDNNDFFGKFLVNTSKCSGVISNINSQNLSVFEFTLFTSNGKFEILGANKMINIYYLKNVDYYPSFKSYINKTKLPSTLERSAYNTYDYVIKLMKNKTRYKKLMLEQHNNSRIIFEFQKKYLKFNLKK